MKTPSAPAATTASAIARARSRAGARLSSTEARTAPPSATTAPASATAEGRSPVESEETLTVEQREIEALYLGLRTVEGVRRLSPPPHLAAQGWIEVRDGRLKCTPEGWLRLDSIVTELTMQTETP